ncbi:uncharacterized protein N7496_012642 [Penicillium cataractarum]|uniref:Uncharacterized protein n=1 Tax=Penicillium cataractarum TaxID=2100454 RepID=A0A9W9R831_9EURO|nr:uncharacterized protein N7496_012642 [Penicillium cataractarum]KAJ5355430.1 hypothetical protein N7496_012642 [Penicillium cataractarum]
MRPSPVNPTEGHDIQTPMPALTGWEDDISIKGSPATANGQKDTSQPDWPELPNDGYWNEMAAHETTEKTEKRKENACESKRAST